LSRLTDISIAELEGRELSEDDYNYIKGFGYVLKPLLEGLSGEEGPKTTLIADVHTDCNTYKVLEEGVGYVKLIVAAYLIPGGTKVLGAGPVFSYYEFKWPMDDRLTDETWTKMLEDGENPPEPDWVRSFMHPVTLPLNDDDDTDRDQLSDTWERSIWGSIEAVNDPRGDPDGDGCTNEREYLAGTDADDPESFLRMLNILPEESGPVVRWSSVAGRRYRVSYSDDLRTWYLLDTPVTAPGEATELSDPATDPPGRRFYRVNIIP